MNILEFIYKILFLISNDILLGFIIYVAYSYFDKKYMSNLEIEQLKIENNYLKEENKKVNGTSTNFWIDNKW
ncbi:MAG: hypothetical protein ACI4VL_02905 [Bacilli bacterium]